MSQSSLHLNESETLPPAPIQLQDDAAPARKFVPDADGSYRSLNRAAVGSIVLFVLGVTSLSFPALVIVPLAGALLGLAGYRTIRRYPEEYSGEALALGGMAACTLLFVGAIGMHAAIYATEVPPDHDRISFSDLQPETKRAGVFIPKKAVELNGQKVFIKGYMHPGVSGMGKVNQFVLVPDMGTCCFGGQPSPTDMILVETTDDARASYAPRTMKVSGEFSIGDQMKDFAGVKGVIYRLHATSTK